ncbi:hypothetical protein BAUCODRAFT_28068 [Baudoinia panamericana UAMH 10762]|uniref:Gem-associated protein 5 TPR domain-containing protein n=1 Tax=Baudoinia panamericana (strain UAMH 10762) TaxID=717646 RepID=M2MKH2_BAUPA|nr:uncharacterized protein BAUCODRAFT_28068 [Baudoinia panamericana UAMH 10762]EMC91828.1 hypothetical protein BAUCODRAFT_28068 [Baudoinia panamericana UAMH 10762]
MSTGYPIVRPGSRTSRRSESAVKHTPPPQTLTPANGELEFEPCAATASFLLYAQRNTVLVLHHDTLAIERRFQLHREDVKWIQADNVSEKPGRLVVSYDTGNTAIVWDILTGGEVARFASYEEMRVAVWMRNGNIAFGNDQGNIILFEPATSEHVSARTIFDPVTALAPSSDCRTFAIGYMNGSILVATLQPSFTIQHTLTTNRAPARITGLGWHGSSSKQRTDMLASQTSDGDLRVWSVPKSGQGGQDMAPSIIRVLQRAEIPALGPCWFAWSKAGRIVQYAEGEIRSWDVRTKKVTYELIPLHGDVSGIANYGPTATLFTLSRDNFVQQYDITPGQPGMQVASARHMPAASVPITPPTVLVERGAGYGGRERSMAVDMYAETESSADEGGAMSPMQKIIAKEMDSLDALESELRDKVMPLSPSSRASSVSSRSSRGSRKGRKYLYDKPDSSRASSTVEGTEFSFGEQSRTGRDSVSIRSISSYQSRPKQYRSSNLRRETPRNAEEARGTAALDLFPFTRARLQEVAFRTPQYGQGPRTADVLQREMLSVVFGWSGDIRSLVRDEMARHQLGSAAGVLLAKWIGDMGADSMTSMMGAEMSSSDWMLLALSNIGADSQKKVGEAFVQRLLEKGDIHPAVAILLGLAEYNDAIEVYVSQKYWMEAVLLTCLTCPVDWGRQSFLIRKWGEAAIKQGQAELAVRCFACAAVESEPSEPWFSPRAQQDAAYAAQQQRLADPGSAGPVTSPLSPPSRSGSGRLTAKNASLKLITTFGDKAAASAKASTLPGVTPIAREPAYNASGTGQQQKATGIREPSTARTATPGGFTRRKRLPSRSEIEQAKIDAVEFATPMTARDVAAETVLDFRRASNSSSIPEPATAQRLTADREDVSHLPSPAQGVFTRLREHSKARDPSRDRKPEGLIVDIMETRYIDAISPAPTTGNEGSMYSSASVAIRSAALSPPLTGGSIKSRAIDDYISSVEEARQVARHERAQSRRREGGKRDESRSGRGTSRVRDVSVARGENIRAIRPAKRSPSSPVPMSPEEVKASRLPLSMGEVTEAGRLPTAEPVTTDDEDFYKMISPVTSLKSHKSGRSPQLERVPHQGIDCWDPTWAGSEDDRGRRMEDSDTSEARSPSAPDAFSPEKQTETDETQSDGQRFRIRARSSSRGGGGDDLQARRAASRSHRARSSSRRPAPPSQNDLIFMPDASTESIDWQTRVEQPRIRPRNVSRKELAAQELEQRRLSLLRGPSAPMIPLPGDLQYESQKTPSRPGMAPRSHTDLGDSPRSDRPPLTRAATVDPEAMMRHNAKPKYPLMGLPATPRAMRLGDVPDHNQPPVPALPEAYSELSSMGTSVTGSSLSQMTGSNLSHGSSSFLPPYLNSSLQGPQSQISSSIASIEQSHEEADDVGPLLPATVFGQKNPLPPARSASAPPEKMNPVVSPAYKPTLPPARRLSVGRGGQVRKIDPPGTSQAGVVSIDEALNSEPTVIIIPEADEEYDAPPPPVLPELSHLAGPPPPPPPPTMFVQAQPTSSDVISIAIDAQPVAEDLMLLPSTTYSAASTYPHPMERATTASPSMHRRGRGSVSESFGSRFRGVADRMRSQSRSQVRGASGGNDGYNAAPYETILPQVSYQSPYEQAMSAGGQDQHIPIPPPPPIGQPLTDFNGRISEQTIPPTTLPGSRSASAIGYRHPREVKTQLRANMPPETLQQGVYNGGFL